MSPASGPPAVVCRGVTFSYGRMPPVLVDVDVEVDAVDFVGIVGPSGSGKSTLLRILAGSAVPRQGRVERRPGLRTSYVPQVETIDWSFPATVAECVLMARLERRRVPWTTRAERAAAEDVLEELGLAGLGARHIRELSGGQQQRMFLARAVHSGAQLILLDEPTSAVDVRTRHDVLHVLDDLHRRGFAVVLSTHDLNGMAAHLPRLVCLNREVIATGTPGEVLVPEVLERTYGARMDVLEHGGMRVVVDASEELALPVAGRLSA